MANVPATGQSGLPEAGERGFAVTGDQRLLQALTTEHFTLQTARSATIMESNGRSALFLSTVSSAVVALAFIGQVADVGQPFFLFALAVLPTLFLLGLLTYLRLARAPARTCCTRGPSTASAATTWTWTRPRRPGSCSAATMTSMA
jgi:hypothetical protein